MRRLDAACTHIMSQLLYRWIPIPYVPIETHSDSPLSLNAKEWEDFIFWRLDEKNRNQELPWIKLLRRNFEGFHRIFIQEVLHHFKIINETGGSYFTFYCPGYPPELRSIADPPAGISLIGTPELLLEPKVAVIGARKASNHAKMETRRLSCQLARDGAVIVSGGALGCDRMAHLGALDSQQEPVPTIVVMAGGLSQFYPRYNRSLFQEIIAKGGAIISERLFETQPKPFDFPVRNRIISGLVYRVLVMEAAQKSGALITAQIALQQGRDVMILTPANLSDVRCLGSVSLIEEGAPSFDSAETYWQGCDEFFDR